jgi:hypothetical protein
MLARFIRTAIYLCLFLLTISPAQARHRHYSHTLRPYYPTHDYRPHAWCGWWLRQQLGVRDANYNLARNWARYGSRAAGPGIGVVVVWRHHVGRIVGSCSGYNCLVQSGNDGHAVRTRMRSVAGAIAFRIVGVSGI